MKKIYEQIEKVKLAMTELSHFINSNESTDLDQRIFNEEYPFSICFNELLLKVNEWGEVPLKLNVNLKDILELSADDMECLHQFRSEYIEHNAQVCKCLTSDSGCRTSHVLRTNPEPRLQDILQIYHNYSD